MRGHVARTAVTSAFAGHPALHRPPRSGVSSGARARRLDLAEQSESVFAVLGPWSWHPESAARAPCTREGPGMPGHEEEDYL